MEAKDIARGIEEFLASHEGISLHPGRKPLSQGELVIKKNGCPCVPGRQKCPCEQAMDDIEELNHCRCYLFVNDAYLKDYEEKVINRKKKKPQGGVGKSSGSAGLIGAEVAVTDPGTGAGAATVRDAGAGAAEELPG